jgi:hypothetical protein
VPIGTHQDGQEGFRHPNPFFFLFVLMGYHLINLMKGVYSMQNVEEITLDKHGRMLFHPEFHPRHDEEYTTEELEYLCKFWEHDHRRSMSFALGRPEGALASLVAKLKKEGLYEIYKNINYHW